MNVKTAAVYSILNMFFIAMFCVFGFKIKEPSIVYKIHKILLNSNFQMEIHVFF